MGHTSWPGSREVEGGEFTAVGAFRRTAGLRRWGAGLVVRAKTALEVWGMGGPTQSCEAAP